jgi:hypothetical protein
MELSTEIAVDRSARARERAPTRSDAARLAGHGLAKLYAALAAGLSRAIEGEVSFDDGSRALYAHDLSIYTHVPIGVVIPRHIDDAITVFEFAASTTSPSLDAAAA